MPEAKQLIAGASFAPTKVAQLDSVDHIPDLIKVGEALAQEVRVEHFRLDHFGQFYQ